MTKSEALKILIMDFQNKMISDDWQYLDSRDEEICKALKIVNPKKEQA